MRLCDLEKLCNSQEAMTAAYRAGLPLLERGWLRYPPLAWNMPAIIAMDGERCVAGLNWKEHEDDLTITIHFAWCDPRYPKAFAAMLLRFRKRYAGSKFTAVDFSCHEGNEPMAKAVKALRLEPLSRYYRMNLGVVG